MSFINNPDNINVDNDISIIDPEMEKKPKLTIAGEILQDSLTDISSFYIKIACDLQTLQTNNVTS